MILRNRADDDEHREAPGTVVWAAAAGTAPLPFIAVYAVIFIVHGGIHKVAPPDVTNSAQGELNVGIFAAVLFVVSVVALLWMLGGVRRWPFVVVQLGMLATAIDFFVDVTTGGRLISFVVAVAALVALACALAPQSWAYFGQQVPKLRKPPVVRDGAPEAVADRPSRDPQSV